MARVIWSEPAALDFDEIIGYIAMDNPDAAERLARRIITHTRQLEHHPLSGPVIPELEKCNYRQITETPCRIFYEVRDDTVIILHMLRSERMLRLGNLGLTN